MLLVALGVLLSHARPPLRASLAPARLAAARAASAAEAPRISFRKDDPPELEVPEVVLTRSVDGTTGTATFRFGKEVRVLRKDERGLPGADVWEDGLVTGMWLQDEEGELLTTDLSLKFVQGKPRELVAILVLKNEVEWERFMRFMKRYSAENGLAFQSSPKKRTVL